MRQIVDFNKSYYAEAVARGETPARVGPSPGFKTLKWLKPVMAGDLLRVGHRNAQLATRPEWGLMRAHYRRQSKGERVADSVLGFYSAQPK
jgi:acyl dehydratase